MELVFALTLFVSAALLFTVQPMFAKMALPLLGGTPAVWNTCMVFYQAALLGGYLYAHLSLRLLGPRRQSLLHLLLLAAPWATLPIAIAAGWRPPAESSPLPALLLLLLTSVGLPFFVVSAAAPMLQAWFSATGHRAGRDPYFLYAASNLGSMLGLLGYPLLVEPQLALAQQTRAWSVAFALLSALIAGCALLLWRSRPAAAAGEPSSKDDQPATRPGWLLRFRWLALATVPSSLMLGVTTHIATDLASVPLLWVIPLALYLLSFVLVFARHRLLPQGWMLRIQAILLLLLAAWFYLVNPSVYWWMAALHLAAFFATAMVCHGQLAATRPHPRYLTEFYLWMAAGGVLGGLLSAIVAPLLFSSIVEYPLMLLAACLLRPAPAAKSARRKWGIPLVFLDDLAFPAALFIWLAVIGFWLRCADWPNQHGLRENTVCQTALLSISTLAAITFSLRPLRFTLGVAALLFASAMLNTDMQKTLYQVRNFYGVIRVKSDGNYHSLEHGTTRHGMQCFFPKRKQREPLTYYFHDGPLGQVFAEKLQWDSLHEVAVIGLGAGTIAAYGLPTLGITFYEINPAMVQVAKNRRLFTYFGDSDARRLSIVLGDARLTLAAAPEQHYDLIICDAFSSDSIPVHLLTREAIELYRRKLARSGLLLLHISNHYVDLAPILGRLANELQMPALWRQDVGTDAQRMQGRFPSTWVLMGRDASDLREFQADARWQAIAVPAGTPLWTDDFSNLVGALRW